MDVSSLAARITDRDRLLSMGRSFPRGVLRLDRGDPDFPTPAHICDAAREAMAQGYTHYIPGYGDRDLIEAICDTLEKDFSARHDPAGVLVTVGSAEAIFLICAAYLSPGDEAIVFTPGFSLYAGAIQMIGAKVVWVPLTPDFHIDGDALRRAITRRTKAIFFSNPSNPTGMAFDRAEIELLGEIAIAHDLLLCPDEVYRKFCYAGTEHVSVLSLPEVRDRTIYIDSFSKSYAMAGWRIGYLATTPTLAAPMYAIHRTAVSCVNWPTQRAALAALRGPQDCVDAIVSEYDRRRVALIARLKDALGLRIVPPTSAFYMLAKYNADMTSAEMVEYLIARGVAVKGGGEFGPACEGYIRLTYATGYEEALRGADRLAEIFGAMATVA
jgi:aspartate/methionine/tyrosine aminotransferase